MKRLLLIEPDKYLANIYEKFFRRYDLKVAKCLSGQSAILEADTNKPDIVVMELQLPGHGGIEFLHEFKSYTDWQSIPIIINSTMPDKLSGLNKNRLGIKKYCYKPATSLRELTNQIRFVIV